MDVVLPFGVEELIADVQVHAVPRVDAGLADVELWTLEALGEDAFDSFEIILLFNVAPEEGGSKMLVDGFLDELRHGLVLVVEEGALLRLVEVLLKLALYLLHRDLLPPHAPLLLARTARVLGVSGGEGAEGGQGHSRLKAAVLGQALVFIVEGRARLIVRTMDAFIEHSSSNYMIA